MNSKKKPQLSLPELLVLFGLFFTQPLIQEIDSFQIKYLELFYLMFLTISLGVIYHFYKNRYKNLSLFFILIFLLFGLLPYCHYITYSIKSDSYNFTEDYLKNNAKLYSYNLEKYKDSSTVKELFSKLKKNKIDENLYDTIQSVGNFNLIFRESDQPEAVVQNKASFILSIGGGGFKNPKKYNEVLISRKGVKKVIKLEMRSDKLKSVLSNYMKEKNEILNMIKYPERYVPFNDFWIDSVTGFAFSFIKPVSKIAQIIRLTQLVSVYFFLHMLSSFLKLSNRFEIVEIKDENG
jgi:hypothetical protein